MIIGNVMMAKAMQKIDNDDLLIFASGVSNSLETDEKAYLREYHLLQKTIEKYPTKKLIYFSTCSIYDSSKKDTEYIKFKLKIEQFIKENSNNYIIFRVGNVVGKGGNPNTLINFLKNSMVNKVEFTLFANAKRLLIAIDDVVKFVGLYQNTFQNEIVDLYYPYQYSVFDVFQVVENEMITNGGGRYKLKDIGTEYELKENMILNEFFKEELPKDYLSRTIARYC